MPLNPRQLRGPRCTLQLNTDRLRESGYPGFFYEKRVKPELSKAAEPSHGK